MNREHTQILAGIIAAEMTKADAPIGWQQTMAEILEGIGKNGERLWRLELEAAYDCCCVSGSCDCYTVRDRSYPADLVTFPATCARCENPAVIVSRTGDRCLFCRDCAKAELSKYPDGLDADELDDYYEAPFLLDENRSDSAEFVAALFAELRAEQSAKRTKKATRRSGNLSPEATDVDNE